MIFEFLLHGFCWGWVTIKRLQSAPRVRTVFLNKKFKDFSRTFKDTFPIFQGLHSMPKKSVEFMSFLVLPQHEQFYPEDISVFAPFRYLGIRVGQSKHRNSRTFQQRLQFSRIFKALNFFLKI